ncbi:diguanylate cyclase (GGDEF) domain-containing protein [Paraburkholderia lycopersici]|uniref:diguanylate cyclase n=2 Tax=Paraburkholderia lycopersici TaxID=416944 RepID=A0A1G7CL58_9BURK|nr:diguanylate cyclase (GGDEF) domain-containing protein [Paraburkholderia lycopersici]
MLLFMLNGLLLAHQWRAYIATIRSESALRIFSDVLLAIEAVSAERGPTNGALGESLPVPRERMAALKAARMRSDTRIQQLLDDLAAENCPACAAQRAMVERALGELAAARKQADLSLRAVREDRTDADVGNVVRRMVAVIPQLLFVSQPSLETIARGDPKTLNYLILARLATELRDQAGQLGSQFTPALVRARPLSLSEQYSIERTLGRIDELRKLIDPRAQDETALRGRAFTEMRVQYFGDGMDYVASIRAQALTHAASITTAQFAQHYVPLMGPVIEFRDDVLALAKREIVSQRDAQFALLTVMVAVSVTLVAVLLLSTWLLRQQVIRPFAIATRLIRAIAAGDYSIDVPRQKYRGEIAALFDAVRVLRANSLQRTHLEQERRELITQLTVMAETDALTQLLNRRAFESRAEAICTKPGVPARPIALVMFDIDHFKRINDTYGHAAGDRALQVIADLCRNTWRRSDLVARLGGEEFVVLIEGEAAANALQMVERFRKRLSEKTIAADSGTVFSISASFGVAVDMCKDKSQLESLLRRADQLLYQAKCHGRDRVEAEDARSDAEFLAPTPPG